MNGPFMRTGRRNIVCSRWPNFQLFNAEAAPVSIDDKSEENALFSAPREGGGVLTPRLIVKAILCWQSCLQQTEPGTACLANRTISDLISIFPYLVFN